jgi:hypothetical protein
VSVVDERGAPVAGAHLRAYRIEGDEIVGAPAEAQASTDARGQAELRLAPGLVTFTALAARHVIRDGLGERYDLRPGVTTRVLVTLQRQARILGEVRGADPGEEVLVQFEDAVDGGGVARVDAEGRFTLDVDPGPVTVALSSARVASSPPRRFEVEPGEERAVRLALQPGRLQVSGQVLGGDTGAPLARVDVQVTTRQGAVLHTGTDASGDFTLLLGEAPVSISFSRVDYATESRMLAQKAPLPPLLVVLGRSGTLEVQLPPGVQRFRATKRIASGESEAVLEPRADAGWARLQLAPGRWVLEPYYCDAFKPCEVRVEAGDLTRVQISGK